MMDFVVDNNILKGALEPIDADHKYGRLIYDDFNESPDYVAEIDADTDEKTTYGEIKERSVRCAVWMKKLGIGPYDLVVVVTHNHLDSCVPVFATSSSMPFSALGITVSPYVNFAFVPPILVNYIAKSNSAQNYDLRSLNTFFIAGCKHSKKILEGIRQNIPTAVIYHTYGSTELGKISATTLESKCIKSAGFVVPNCQIKFVDLISDEVLGPNQKGEIRVKNSTCTTMIGYYKDPESTRQASDEEGWYRTGDVGYYDETGAIFIVDRIKEIMKCKLHHVSPAEIEELLLSHPEVQAAAVVAIPYELDGDWPTAFIKKTPGGRVTEDDIVKLISVLEDCKKLRGEIYFIDNLPQTGSGKVAKNEPRQLAINLKNNRGF